MKEPPNCAFQLFGNAPDLYQPSTLMTIAPFPVTRHPSASNSRAPRSMGIRSILVAVMLLVFNSDEGRSTALCAMQSRSNHFEQLIQYRWMVRSGQYTILQMQCLVNFYFKKNYYLELCAIQEIRCYQQISTCGKFETIVPTKGGNGFVGDKCGVPELFDLTNLFGTISGTRV